MKVIAFPENKKKKAMEIKLSTDNNKNSAQLLSEAFKILSKVK